MNVGWKEYWGKMNGHLEKGFRPYCSKLCALIPASQKQPSFNATIIPLFSQLPAFILRSYSDAPTSCGGGVGVWVDLAQLLTVKMIDP